MLTHKHIGKICCGVLAVCFAISIVFMNWELFGITEAENTNTYATKLFSELDIHTIDIIVDADTWHDMLDNASDKEYITCNLVIDGEAFYNIAIRPKGNSSLQQVQSNGSDRYSFKIEFDHYDNTTTYYGLDKLALNNIVQDNTYMKDYLAYTLMNEFGVASPLTNYVSLSVNGEAFGLYLAVEAIEESFLQRNYGDDYGLLYKPETSGGNAGGGVSDRTQSTTTQASTQEDPMAQGMDQMGGQSGQMGMMPGMTGTAGIEMPSREEAGGMTEETMPEDTAAIPERTEMAQSSGQSPGRSSPGGTSSSGLSSAFGYDGDDPASYSYIFDNNVIDTSDFDEARLVTSIKQLNEQENLEEVVDIEQVIRYFIVHNFLLNFDSYTGGIMHNYYLYEEDGVMTMLPWDYNLSFVAFQTSYTTEEMINFPIDTPVSGNTVEDRPMLSWIFANEEYTQLYHTLFEEFIDELFLSGYFENTVNAVETLISDEVASDPSKFCTFEQFVQGVDTLKAFVSLRVESILGQLDGTIGSTDQAQANDPNLISAGDVDVTDTGTESVQRGEGNVQSPTRNQGGGQSMGGGQPGMMSGGQSMGGGMQMPGMTQMNEIGQNVTQATQAMGLSDTQILLIACGVVFLAGLLLAMLYKRRSKS